MKKSWSAILCLAMMACAVSTIATAQPLPTNRALAPEDTKNDLVSLARELRLLVQDQNDLLRLAINKLPNGGQVFVAAAPAGAPAPAAAQDGSPIVKACSESWVSCGLQLLASAGTGTVDAIKALVPLAQPIAAIHTTRAQADASVKTAGFSRDQNIALYSAFANMGAADAAAYTAISANGVQALAQLAAAPSTAVTVTGNGPVNTGTGSIVNASNNPVTTAQPPVVVVGTPTTTVSRGP